MRAVQCMRYDAIRCEAMRCAIVTPGGDFDDTVCSKRTHYPRELKNFVNGFGSILMSHIQFRPVVKRSSSVEVERGIFDYYSVMRRTQSSDLLVFVHDRCNLRFSVVLC